jgi:ABC-2 type transport system ATP-binding protein
VADIIQQLKRRGKTVFFSTHIINDVERICDDVLLLGGGDVRYHGSVKTVVDQSYNTYEVVVRNGAAATAMEPGFVLSEAREGETVRLSVPKQNLEAVIAKVSHHGELLSVEPERRSLEQIFVELIKSSGGSKGGE